jgi:hypothetical protein
MRGLVRAGAVPIRLQLWRMLSAGPHEAVGKSGRLVGKPILPFSHFVREGVEKSNPATEEQSRAVREDHERVRQNLVLTDTFGRNHTYLRISLTERCNLRCGPLILYLVVDCGGACCCRWPGLCKSGSLWA